MSRNQTYLKNTTRPKGINLVFAWFALVFIPAVLFIWLFEMILDNGEVHIKETAINDMYSEIEDYRDKLKCQKYLEQKQQIIAKSLGFKSHKNGGKLIDHFKNLKAKHLHENIEKELGVRVTATFYHGPDTRTSSHFISPEIAKDFLISQTMLKNLFKSINDQHLKYPCLADSRIRKSSPEDLEKLESRSRAFIKTLFQYGGDFDFEANKVNPAISGKPELRKIYFFYSAAELNSQGKVSNLGGFITIIREQDIPIKKLFNFAIKSSNTGKFHRSLGFYKFKNIANFNNFTTSMTSLEESVKSVKLFATIPSETMVRIISNDTYYPFNLKKILKKFPVLQISVDRSDLEHPLRRFLKPVKLACSLAVLFATLIFLRMYFFGYQMPFKIRAKIMSAVLSASILPFSALWVMSAYHENFRREFRQFEMINFLSQKFEEFNISIDSFRTSLENENAALSDKLGTMQDYEYSYFLSQWMKNRPISHITTRIKRNDDELTTTENQEMEEFEIELRDVLFTCVENSFRKKKEDGSRNDGVVGLFRIQIKGIGVFLSDIGLIHNSNFSNSDALYSLIPVFPGNDKYADVESVFLLKYSTKLLMHDFFRMHPDFFQDEFKEGFKIQKCYIPLESPTELPSRKNFIHDKDFEVEKIIEKARRVLLSKSERTWTSYINDRLQITHVNFSPTLQTLVIMVAEQTEKDRFSILPSPVLLGLYLLGVIIVIVTILGKIFVDPVKTLQKSAEEVAAGNFEQRIELKSHDEFDHLSQAFNGMIAGLDEREKLSNFVSDDVLSEVEDNREMVLVPGGERTEVAVVFCSLPELKKLSLQSDSEKILEALGKLIDVADFVSRKNNGVIDKIIEDTVMLVFRQSDAGNTHVISACRTALQIAQMFPNSKCPMKISAGIASGKAVSGKIGSRDGKLDYTVIGNPVNLAARLKAQAWMADQTGILLCPQTIRMLRGTGKLRFLERIEIKGRTRTFPMYELLSLRDTNLTDTES